MRERNRRDALLIEQVEPDLTCIADTLPLLRDSSRILLGERDRRGEVERMGELVARVIHVAYYVGQSDDTLDQFLQGLLQSLHSSYGSLHDRYGNLDKCNEHGELGKAQLVQEALA